MIGPGVELARAQGFPADGPFPADTIFVRATRKDGQGYDGVLTMYHDQGQIAMKLMGFDRGVTVPGGLPIPIATPAHGTAYDIAGKGHRQPGAMRNAFALACRMGATRGGGREPLGTESARSRGTAAAAAPCRLLERVGKPDAASARSTRRRRTRPRPAARTRIPREP